MTGLRFSQYKNIQTEPLRFTWQVHVLIKVLPFVTSSLLSFLDGQNQNVSTHSLEHLRFLAARWGRVKHRDLTSRRPRSSYVCVGLRLLGSLSAFDRMNLLMKIWSGEHLSWRCTADARCSSDDEGSRAESSIYCLCTVHLPATVPA